MNRKRTTVSRLLRWLLPAGLAVMAWSFSGCEGWGTGPDYDQEETLAALRYLIEQDEAFSIDGLGEDSYQDDDYSSTNNVAAYGPVSYPVGLAKALGDTLWPRNHLRIRWMRRITDHHRDVAIDTLFGDMAFVTITGTLSGTFHTAGVDTDDVGNFYLADTISKPFEITITRRAWFTRVSNVITDSTLGWQVTALTAMVGISGSKVSLDRVTVSNSSGTILTIAGGDTLLNLFYNRDILPALPPSMAVTLEVGVGNLAPEFPIGPGEMVVARRVGRLAQRFMHRNRMNDASIPPDQTAEDNVYTGVFLTSPVPDQPRPPFRFFIGVTDISSVLVANEDYHTAFVGLPYRIAAGS